MLKTILLILTAPLWLPLAILGLILIGAFVYMIGYAMVFVMGSAFFFLLFLFGILPT